MLPALLLASLLAVPTGATTEVFGGRTMTNLVGWDDALMAFTHARMPAANFPGWAAFPAGGLNNAYLFDKSSDECLEGMIQLSHSYSEGTSLYPHMHWAPVTNGAGSVAWVLDYTLTPLGGTATAAGPVYVSQATPGVASKQSLASFAAIACAACTISSILNVKICRDANDTGGLGDTYDDDVAGLYFDVHYQINTVGSATELLK